MPGKDGKISMNFILEQLDENELDLSMNGLDTVPVREIAKVRKGTALDLSRNNLQFLPENFGMLNHLLSLDLSSNQLKTLPEAFGKLSLLQKLDLYSNQLTFLPLSFWQLKKLRWLDLKKNPLEDDLKEAAGKCVSPQDCTQCANQVLVYMKQCSSRAERERQNELRKQREKELRKKEDEARQLAASKRERAAKRKSKKEQDQQQVDNGSILLVPSPPLIVDTTAGASKAASGGGKGVCWVCVKGLRYVCMWMVLPMMLLLLLLVSGLILCPMLMKPSVCPVLHSEYILHCLDQFLYMLRLISSCTCSDLVTYLTD